MTPHTVVVTFTDWPIPLVFELKARDSVHAIRLVFIEIPECRRASVLRVNVSVNAR